MKGKKVHDVLNRLHLAMPAKRDEKVNRWGCSLELTSSFTAAVVLLLSYLLTPFPLFSRTGLRSSQREL